MALQQYRQKQNKIYCLQSWQAGFKTTTITQLPSDEDNRAVEQFTK